MHTKSSTTTLVILLLPVLIASLHAQSWRRDSTFGTQGIAWIDDAFSNDHLETPLVFPDEKILFNYRTDGVYETTLYMLTPEGKTDLSFGDQGRFIRAETNWSVLAAQAGGKFLAAGIVQDWSGNGNNSALWRYLPAGIPDSTFGGDGQVDSLFGDFYYQRVDFLAPLPNGKIIVAGIAQDNGSTQHFQLARLNADGSRDLSFGQNGFAGFSFPFEQYRFDRLVAQPDGKLLVASNMQTSGHRNLVVLRFLPDGAPDTGFGTAGKTNTDFSLGDDFANSLLVYPDGKILAAGGYVNKSTGKSVPAMVRYLPDGKPDPAFGQAGEISLPNLDLIAAFSAVQRLSDDYLLTVLPRNSAGNSSKAFQVKRFKPNGQADDTLNAETSVDDDWGLPVNAYGSFAWTADNTLLHFSNRNNTAPADRQLAVARYVFDGSLTGLTGHAGEQPPAVRLLPNPASGPAQLSFDTYLSGKGFLAIFSAMGMPILRHSIDAGATTVFLRETASWPAGVYFWQFTPERGTATGGYWIKTAR